MQKRENLEAELMKSKFVQIAVIQSSVGLLGVRYALDDLGHVWKRVFDNDAWELQNPERVIKPEVLNKIAEQKGLV